ncbi:unnamed protein product, partial [Pylaiella littoralis]
RVWLSFYTVKERASDSYHRCQTFQRAETTTQMHQPRPVTLCGMHVFSVPSPDPNLFTVWKSHTWYSSQVKLVDVQQQPPFGSNEDSSSQQSHFDERTQMTIS